MGHLFLDNNTSKVETIITITMGRQRKTHRKSHEGCEQCKDRHIKVRTRTVPSACLCHIISDRDCHSTNWLSHVTL